MKRTDKEIIINGSTVALSLINITKVAAKAGMSISYCSLLLNGHKKNAKAKNKVYKAILSLYGQLLSNKNILDSNSHEQFKNDRIQYNNFNKRRKTNI